jgi:putative flippase GtrA
VSNTLSSVVARLRTEHSLKLIRFGAVSAFNVMFGQAILYGAQVVLHWPPVAANVFSVSLGTFPAYFLSRYWVWEKRGRNRVMAEIFPFWMLTLMGFALSTTAVWLVDSRWETSPLVINLTSLTAFGLVWLAKFFVLDRVLFKPEKAPAVV